jgi:prevent-host-death family protein
MFYMVSSEGIIMREYGVYEAKTKLPDLIKQVQQGERITITNRGMPVADLVPSASRAGQQAMEAIEAIKAMRTGTINQSEFVEMRNQGRR